MQIVMLHAARQLPSWLTFNVRQKMTKELTISRAFGGLLTCLIVVGGIYLGFRELSVSVWLSGDEPRTYRIEGQDGRVMSIFILPKNEVILGYSDPRHQSLELVQTTMRGTYGKHYFWRLWRIDRLGTFGWRIYDDGAEPVDMEIEVRNKFRSGMGDSGFPAIGQRTNEIMLFGKDRIRFSKMWLTKVPTDPELIKVARDVFSKQ